MDNTAPAPSDSTSTASWAAKLKGFVTSFPFGLFVVSRIAYMGISWMGLTTIPRLYFNEEYRQTALQPYPLIDGLCRWDCGWMHNVAVNGYANVEYAKVFPLFAMIGAAIERVTGINHLVGFLIVANLCSLAAYFVVYKLFTELEGEEVARLSLLLWVSYPFSYYQASGYPESMMMLATAVAVSLARKNQHLRAALALTVGFAARHLTLTGGAALLAGQLRQRGFHPKKFLLSPAVLGLLLPWAFLAAFSWYLGEKVGDPLAWWTSRKIGWNDYVWYGARQILLYVPYEDRPEYYYYLIFSIPMVAGGAGLAWKFWQRPRDYAELSAFGVVLLLVVLSSGAAGMGRYQASNWACFLPLGLWLSRSPKLQGPILGLSWMFQGLWFFLYSHQWRVL